MLHQIGVGALGPVFRTYEPTRDRLVAVKVFRLDVTPEQARALADELAKAADAGLFHPSIVEPVAAGIEGTVAYRAEEYVAAESLDVAMRHYAPATVDKVLPFITQLASALDFARAAGVGHGALHPRDIFVTPDEARATGFGVVDALDRLGLRAPVRRPYSPPERIAGEAWSTPADVFSLGVIAFELLTGRRPSGLGDDMGPLTGATLGDRAEKVRAVLARAMLASPLARYATACAFSAALAKAAGVAETTVSLVDKSLGMAIAPSAELEPQITPAEPMAPPVDLPLAAALSAADPVKDAVIEGSAQALDDFAAEPELPSPTDSPREAVRKVIAAREARKRQVRKKPVDDVATDAAVAAPAEEAEAVPVAEGLPVAGVLFDTSKVDVQAATPPVELESVEHEALELKPAELTPAEIRPGELKLKKEMLTEAPLERASLEEVALEETPLVDASTRSGALGEVGEVPLDFVAPVRDLPDRVVAVDEFRAREAANPKLDRSWPRVAEPSLLDRSERVVTARSSAAASGPASGSGLGLGLSSASTGHSAVADVPPSAFEEGAPARQRLEMLPMALLVGLGLVLGYPLGYVVGHRDKAAPVADATLAPRAEGQTATAATGTAGANETTVSVPPPTKPTDALQRASARGDAFAGGESCCQGSSRGAAAARRQVRRDRRSPRSHVKSGESGRHDQRQVEWTHAADPGRSQIRQVRRARRAERVRGGARRVHSFRERGVANR